MRSLTLFDSSRARRGIATKTTRDEFDLGVEVAICVLAVAVCIASMIALQVLSIDIAEQAVTQQQGVHRVK